MIPCCCGLSCLNLPSQVCAFSAKASFLGRFFNYLPSVCFLGQLKKEIIGNFS